MRAGGEWPGGAGGWPGPGGDAGGGWGAGRKTDVEGHGRCAGRADIPRLEGIFLSPLILIFSPQGAKGAREEETFEIRDSFSSGNADMLKDEGEGRASFNIWSMILD